MPPHPWSSKKKPHILEYKTVVCVCLCVRHADLSATLSLLWEFEVLLELTWQGDTVF